MLFSIAYVDLHSQYAGSFETMHPHPPFSYISASSFTAAKISPRNLSHLLINELVNELINELIKPLQRPHTHHLNEQFLFRAPKAFRGNIASTTRFPLQFPLDRAQRE